MAIKQFIFSFKIEAKDLFEYIAERNVAVNIDAYGTAPKPKKQQKAIAAPPPVLALPAPKNGKRTGIQAVIIAFMVAHQQEDVTAEGLRALIAQSGYSEKYLNNQIFHLRRNKLIRSTGRGKYRATAKAVRAMEAANG